MPVSSLLLELKRGCLEEVALRLKAMPGVEVHEAENDHIVITTDTASIAEDRRLADEISRLPNVVTASVVFTNMEDALLKQA